MTKYGYIGKDNDIPQQAFKANAGVLSVNEHIKLSQENKLTQYGQLELIQTQTVSNAISSFTNLNELVYDVHFITFTDIHFPSQSEFGYQLSNDGGSTYETGYHFANQRMTESAGDERKSASQNTARLFGDISNNALGGGNGYMYLYSAGDTSYTYSTSHCTFRDASDKCANEWGSQLYDHGESISAIRFGLGTGMGTFTSGTISLYGLRYY